MNYSNSPTDKAAIQKAHRAAGVKDNIRRANKAFKAGKRQSRGEAQRGLWK